MSKHTLEQVLEALINKEDDRASDLLHQFFVQKGKSIYGVRFVKNLSKLTVNK